MNATTTIKFGNNDITITLTGGTEWKGGENARVYFDLEEDSKKQPVAKFYEVLAGATSDNAIEIEGRTFAYSYGFCDSNTKRRAADTAAADLAAQIVAQTPEPTIELEHPSVKTIYLIADALHGVREIDPEDYREDYEELVITPADHFIRELPRLELFEEIVTVVTKGDDHYETSSSQYGIELLEQEYTDEDIMSDPDFTDPRDGE